MNQVVELTQFKRTRPLRSICDASKQRLGTVLQQNQETNWKQIAYASGFLPDLKQNFHELQVLAVVRSVGHFKTTYLELNSK